MRLATKGFVSPAGYECRPYTPYEELWHGIRTYEWLLKQGHVGKRQGEAQLRRLHEQGLEMAIAMANNATAKGLPVSGELRRNIELHKAASRGAAE